MRVLFVDDQIHLYERGLRKSIDRLPMDLNLELNCEDQGVTAITQGSQVDVLVLDLEFPGQEVAIRRKLGERAELKSAEAGLAILEYYTSNFPDVPVIIVTGNDSPAFLGRCWKQGAHKYIAKSKDQGLDYNQLAAVIYDAAELVRAKRAHHATEQSEVDEEDFIVKDPVMWEIVIEAGQLAARSDISILLLGESGVGKEHLACFIHKTSERAEGPFVAVNMAAIPETLVESHLFGHEKGAFTDASERRIGLFEQADGGTLFLDEIAEATLDVQKKILRALQEKQIRRVGGTRDINIDVRVVAATNRDVETLIQEGKFREDLYYRIAGGSELWIPPLRERSEDVTALAEFFLRRHYKKHRQGPLEIPSEVLEALHNYYWPGNVRELERRIERAAILASGPVLKLSDLNLPTGLGYGSSGDELVEELAAALEEGDDAAKLFIEDIELLVYDRLYQKLGSHTGVSEIWGKAPSAMDSQRQRWVDKLAAQIVEGQRSIEDVPGFLKDRVFEKVEAAKKTSSTTS